MVFFKAIRGGAFVFLLAFASGLPAQALNSFTFQTPGADKTLGAALKASSLTQVEVNEKNTADPQQLLAAAQADYARLVGTLYEEGYFSGVVTIRIDGREAAAIAPLNPPGSIRTIAITVEPGPRFAFGRARVAPVTAETELPADFATGAPAATNVIRDSAIAAVDGWRNAGHAKATPGEQRITADHKRRILDAEVDIVPGPRVTFGDFLVRGNKRVSTERIYEIAGFPKKGEVYDPAELARAATRLRRTGTFRSVSLQEATTLNPDGTLDIETELIEEKRRRLGYGAEISSVEGLTLSAYWLHRNLLGGAENLRLDGEISGIGDFTGGIDYRFAARLTRPGTFTPTTDLYIEAELERLDEPDYLSDSAKLGFGFTKTVSDTLSAEAGLRFRFARVTDSNGTTDFTHLSLPLAVTWNTRDNELDPRKGYYLNTTLEPFLGLNGTESGARLTADARAYRAVGENFTLALRGQFGSVAGASLLGVPPDFRFYSGGGGTVRGHSYQSLGVDLGGGVRSGGRSFAALSLEARAKVSDKFGVVGFFDVGYVGAESFPDGSGQTHSGAGLGIRYYTGIGPIRLDVATPVSGPGVGSNVQVYVGIGHSF